MTGFTIQIFGRGQRWGEGGEGGDYDIMHIAEATHNCNSSE